MTKLTIAGMGGLTIRSNVMLLSQNKYIGTNKMSITLGLD